MTPDSFVWIAERGGPLLAIAALGTGVGTLLSRSRACRTIAAGILVGLSFLPIGGVSGLTFLYSVVGPLSLATIVGCTVYIGSMLGLIPALARNDVILMAAVVALLGLALYPAAIGLLPWDPYRLGFHGALLPIALLIIAVVSGAANSIITPLWIAASAAAWQSGVFSSRNLWDYTVDPVAWIASLALVTVAAVRHLISISRTQSQP